MLLFYLIKHHHHQRLKHHTLRFSDHQSLVDTLTVLLKKRRHLEDEDIKEYFKLCGVVREANLWRNMDKKMSESALSSKYVEELVG
jgi:hypothetical protein